MGIKPRSLLVSCIILAITATAGLIAQEPFRATHAAQLAAMDGVPDSARSVGLMILRLDLNARKWLYRISLAKSDAPVTRVVLQRNGGDHVTVLRTFPFPGTALNADGVADGVTDEEINTIDSGMAEIVVYTENEPAGLMIGELGSSPNLVTNKFDASSETSPPVGATGEGQARMTVDEATHSAKYFVTWDGLSGAATAVNIHRAPVGQDGPTVFTIPSNGGSMLMGRWTGMSEQDVAAAKAGNLYIDIVTGSNPTGEIRGQLLRMDGFTVAMESANVVPSVIGTDAGGTGMVIVTSGEGIGTTLTGIAAMGGSASMVESVDIHRGYAGQNGSVFQGLTNADGAWSKWDAQISSTQDIGALQAGGMYMDFHTTAYPGGEARGQLIPNATNFSSLSAVPSEQAPGNSTVSMSWFDRGANAIELRLNGDVAPDDQLILLYDALGRRVATMSVAGQIAHLDARQLGQGVYTIQVISRGRVQPASRVAIVR